MSTQTKSRRDVYAIITDKIIEQLNTGTAPWRKPWAGAGIPTNLISKRPYRGINTLLLSMLGYENNYFLTSKQLNDIGGAIKPDEKPHLVVFWNFPEVEVEEDDQNTNKKKPMLRYYTVFNIGQCDGIPESYVPSIDREVVSNVACKVLVNNMPNCPRIQHKEQRAYYNPLNDFINMPKQASFNTDDSYYSTLFHELVHSTGHSSRCNRKDLIQMSEFGVTHYSHEELVAEIGSCFLQSHVGIVDEFEQSATYISGWLEVLKNDRRFIFSASSAAQKAVDYILGDSDDNNKGDMG